MYSQYEEDIILKQHFNNKNGFLVDIGAADGIRFSNSYQLLLNGWKGILIEPNIKNFNKLQNLHKNNTNVILINEAAGKESKDSILYCDVNDDHEQLSTLSKEQSISCINYFGCDFYEQKIKVSKTSEIFDKFNVKKIDFLTIDTETLDYEVLLGIDFNKINIDLICVEHNNEDIEKLMLNNDYTLYKKTVGNFFYIKNK